MQPYSRFLAGIDFELIEPGVARARDGRFTLSREHGPGAALLELPGAPWDALNTRLEDGGEVRRTLRPLCDIPRMSTFALGAILNRGVRSMRPSDAFLNVGVWNGFSLLSGLCGNPDRICIGVDNFSQFGGPKEALEARFEQYRSPAHRFFDMDYEEYLRDHHRDPIGFYFYDGHHAYEHQLRGLQLAEPFFSDACIVMVDDANWSEPRQATLDFIAGSDRHFAPLFDVRTADWRHPTFWNGLMLFQAAPEPPPRSVADAVPPPEHPQPPEATPIDFASRETGVSVVVVAGKEDREALAATSDDLRAQTWPNVEVVVADGPVRQAVESTRNPFVALVEAGLRLDDNAVEAGLTLPQLSRFQRGLPAAKRKARIRWALEVSRDVVATLPDAARAVVAGRAAAIPQSITDRAAELFEGQADLRALDADWAIARLEELRAGGARFAVFTSELFDWLAARPPLDEHLRTGGELLLDNDRVRVFSLEAA